jgi:uncharacterized membrane protein YobD (UPF0266 family)
MFAFLDLLLAMLVILFVAFAITQVFIPVINGTRWFPLLLKESSKLDSELTSVNQEVVNSVVAEKIEQARKRVRKPKTV